MALVVLFDILMEEFFSGAIGVFDFVVVIYGVISDDLTFFVLSICHPLLYDGTYAKYV